MTRRLQPCTRCQPTTTTSLNSPVPGRWGRTRHADGVCSRCRSDRRERELIAQLVSSGHPLQAQRRLFGLVDDLVRAGCYLGRVEASAALERAIAEPTR